MERGPAEERGPNGYIGLDQHLRVRVEDGSVQSGHAGNTATGFRGLLS